MPVVGPITAETAAREMKKDLGIGISFPVMSRIRGRISENFADGLSSTLPDRHLSDRGGGAPATISAPIMCCWGLPWTLFWGHSHKAGLLGLYERVE